MKLSKKLAMTVKFCYDSLEELASGEVVKLATATTTSQTVITVKDMSQFKFLIITNGTGDYSGSCTVIPFSMAKLNQLYSQVQGSNAVHTTYFQYVTNTTCKLYLSSSGRYGSLFGIK